MKNVDVKVENNVLTIKVDLTERNGLSGSGKNEVIATTSGNAEVPGAEHVKFGLNVFCKPGD